MSKLRMLYWGDTPTVSTGFGVVAKHVLKALHNTGKYEINVLGINYFGNFYDRVEFPYQIVPAKLLEPNDPYGNRMLIKNLIDSQYDILFVINDTYVTNGIASEIAKYKTQYNPDLKIIYYYPIDCGFLPSAAALVHLADKPVTYTEFAKKETLSIAPELEDKLEVIYHGTDTKVYHTLPNQVSRQARLKYFNVEDDETTIFINVNRNSVRKNLAQSILAFSEFKNQTKKNCLLYLHTTAKDQGIDLQAAVDNLGLSTKTDVVFPINYTAVNAIPDYILNEFYNAADYYLTTTLGEGWGLSITEAMAAGLPVIAPNHTSIPEILGSNRGIICPTSDYVWVDNSGYRPLASTQDFIDSMLQATNLGSDEKTSIIKEARMFTEKHSWQNIGKKWVDLFTRVENSKPVIKTEIL